MKKFELGKVYQQMNRDGSVRAEFKPLFIGEEKAFGIWQTLLVTSGYSSCEFAIEHHLLEERDDRLRTYREKPPEPESIELFVNIYKDKNGKLSSGGVHYCQSKADLANNYDGRDRISTAYIKFTEPQK